MKSASTLSAGGMFQQQFQAISIALTLLQGCTLTSKSTCQLKISDNDSSRMLSLNLSSALDRSFATIENFKDFELNYPCV
jgi:hypothetical protein